MACHDGFNVCEGCKQFAFLVHDDTHVLVRVPRALSMPKGDECGIPVPRTLLTDGEFSASRTFLDCFLLCFRKFMDPERLLTLLENRALFCTPTAINSAMLLASEKLRNTEVTPIQVRVVSVLRHWIGTYWDVDFASNSELTDQLRAVASALAKVDSIAIPASNLLRQIDGLVAAQAEPHAVDDPLSFETAKKFAGTSKLLEISGVELSAQLCKILVPAVRQMPPVTYMTYPGTKNEWFSHTLNPVRLEKHHERTRTWLAAEILSSANPVQAVEKIVAVARASASIQDYETTAIAIEALNVPQVDTLNSLWTRVPKELVQTRRALASLISPLRTHAAYHKAVARADPPMVPLQRAIIEQCARIARQDSEQEEVDFAPLESAALLVLESSRSAKPPAQWDPSTSRYEPDGYTSISGDQELLDWCRSGIRSADEIDLDALVPVCNETVLRQQPIAAPKEKTSGRRGMRSRLLSSKAQKASAPAQEVSVLLDRISQLEVNVRELSVELEAQRAENAELRKRLDE
jgi:RasGEF N-terminal motif/RasGEF domain